MRQQLSIVLFLSAMAQVAAFGKSVVIALLFGVGAELDGYYLAQAIPAVMTGILMGFLQTGFVSTYAGHLARGENATASAVLGRSLITIALVGTGAGALLSAVAPWLVSLVGPDVSPSAHASAVMTLRVLAFLVVLNGLADCATLALNAHGSFAMAALAPVANAVIATTLLLALPSWGIGNLIWGTLIGVATQLVLVAYEVWRRRIRLSYGALADLRPVVIAGSAIVPGLVFANLSVLVPQVVAARLGDGAVAALSMAMRLHGALVQVLAISLSTVLLPHFALAVGRGDLQTIARQLGKGFPMVAIVSIAATLWVGLLGEPVVAILFKRGAFDQVATGRVASTWFWLTTGLLPIIWGAVVAKVLQAFCLGAVMSRIAFVTLVLTAGLCIALAGLAGLDGLALAVTLSALGATAACSLVVVRRVGSLRSTWGTAHLVRMAKLALIAVGLSGAALASSRLLSGEKVEIQLVGVTLCIGLTMVGALFHYITVTPTTD